MGTTTETKSSYPFILDVFLTDFDFSLASPAVGMTPPRLHALVYIHVTTNPTGFELKLQEIRRLNRLWSKKSKNAFGQRVKFPVRLFLANQIVQKFQTTTVPDVEASEARNAWEKAVSLQIPARSWMKNVNSEKW